MRDDSLTEPAPAGSVAPVAPGARRPSLSVVMPNYNHGRYLKRALLAHLQQTAPPREIIVVDDASTDDSQAVVERVMARHPVVRLVRRPSNAGVNAAINRGLAEAASDYVCVSAADDLVGPQFTARSLDILARHPDAGFCFSDPAELLGDTGLVRPFPLFLSERPCLFSPLELRRLLRRNFFSFSSNTILYRRDALLAVGGLIEDLQWYADWYADFVLAFQHGACYVPEVLAYFRVSPDSYSATGRGGVERQRRLVYRVLDLLAADAPRDVADAFRDSAIVPEMRTRVLVWLLASRRYRAHLTPRLAARLVFGGLWGALMPYTPAGLRRAARWLLGAPTRRAMARQGSVSAFAAGGDRW